VGALVEHPRLECQRRDRQLSGVPSAVDVGEAAGVPVAAGAVRMRLGGGARLLLAGARRAIVRHASLAQYS
jgi:hypothetical protein